MIELFDYQQVALEKIVDAFKTKVAALVVMACGLGKTVVAAAWARGELIEGRKGLFLCHENGILDQALGEFQNVVGPEYCLKTFYGDRKDWNADKADIVFASFQTFVTHKHAFFENEFDFVVVDESHHGQAPTYRDVILYFKPKKLLGITATPDREDMKDIREIFGEEVVNYTLVEALARGWLTPVEYRVLNDRLSHWKLKRIMKEVLEEGRRVSIKQLNETIFIDKRDEEIAQVIKSYTGNDKKAIIFCENTRHADNFQPFLESALTYHCKVKGGRKENRNRLAAFRKGSLQQVLAVDKFNEGVDVPDTEVIVFLRCTDSKTVFYQQLGRGLRKIPGKNKVLVLDFVANCERLMMIKELRDDAGKFPVDGDPLPKDPFRASGSSFDFIFSNDLIDIIGLIRRISQPLYETWQEASRVALSLGIEWQPQYLLRYKEDPRLPSAPYKYYPDWPGWPTFFGRARRPYDTWQDASEAAIDLGLESEMEYKNLYKDDCRLPGAPNNFYSDFPDWYTFLGKQKVDLYGTLEEAMEVAIRIGFNGLIDYKKRAQKIDPRLPTAPQRFSGFPGWEIFLGKYYSTWQEAGSVCARHGVRTKTDYLFFRRKKVDRKLPAKPHIYYKDFPGWDKFLSVERPEYYKTWQEAGAVAAKLGFVRNKDYKRNHGIDPMLPPYPEIYYPDFPGWTKFFGKRRKIVMDYYKTWQEASAAAIKLGIRSQHIYPKRRKEDPSLPGSPRRYYDDFPGWVIFLGKKSKNLF